MYSCLAAHSRPYAPASGIDAATRKDGPTSHRITYLEGEGGGGHPEALAITNAGPGRLPRGCDSSSSSGMHETLLNRLVVDICCSDENHWERDANYCT